MVLLINFFTKHDGYYEFFVALSKRIWPGLLQIAIKEAAEYSYSQ